MKLSSDKDLYEFLVALSAELDQAGARELGESVARASRTASTIPATEFLGESRIALRQVLKGNPLGPEKSAELQDVLRQIDAAFESR